MTRKIKADARQLSQMKNLPAVARLAGMALLSAKHGSLTLALPDGRQLEFNQGNSGPQALMHVHSFDFARRAMIRGDIGFAESYMAGDWTTPDLTEVLLYLSANFEAAGKFAVGGSVVRWINKLKHVLNRNSRSGAKRNILAHYDLGNEFYSLWLDPTMTYSSALFDRPNLSLEQAQGAKYEAIAQALLIGPDSSVLEIGCGWGGFAEHVVKNRGAHITCLTLSEAQYAYTKDRIHREGLAERVDIRLEDYRDHEGHYDGVASIEMFEAVGEKYWGRYFDKVRDVLKTGRRAALQIITIRDDLFARYRKRADFIQHYIFPGGMLPNEPKLREHILRAGLSFDGSRLFGRDYARTLKIWSRSFNEAWNDIRPQGFDEHFRRLWEFYFSYCAAGFQTGRINVGQYTLTKL